MKKSGMRLFSLFLLTVMLAGICLFPTSADEIEWNLLTDKEAGYRIENKHGTWMEDKEADGTPYMYNVDNKSGALYIWDDNNILSTYKTFSLSGDFYFESFPTGLRDGQYTPEQRPLSFLCWMYGKGENSYIFNALRIDSEGRIHTGSDGDKGTDVKLELNQWMNIKCVFTPETGICEMQINDRKVLDFTIAKFDPEIYTSACARYFDGYYNWSAKMKNLLVQSDNEYEVELKREDSADFVGYQTTKPESGSFDARFVFGVDKTDFDNVGYEVSVIGKDSSGEVVTKQFSAKDNTVYSSIKDGAGKSYLAKAVFGYQYTAAMELEDLPEGDFELVVRPYTMLGSLRRYGKATRLYYYGDKDSGGYPVFSTTSVDNITIKVSDDTYIYNEGSSKTKFFGDAAQLFVRNTGGESTGLYRAAYFRFDIDKDVVAELNTAAKATLRIYIKSNETHAQRKQYEMQAFGTGANWTEDTLNFANRNELAPRGEKLVQQEYSIASYFVVDILNYLQRQTPNADGSMSVSFCITQADGYGDALLAYVSSKEGDFPATIEIGASMAGGAELNLPKMNNEGFEPWGYAEGIVNEWFDELEPKVYPKNADGSLKPFDIEDLAPEGYAADQATGDFTREMPWLQGTAWQVHDLSLAGSTWNKYRYARTLETLGTASGNEFLQSEYADTITEFDEYGGIANAGFTGKKTGYFHVETHNGRPYIIDPLGNPYFSVGINTFVLGDNQNAKDYSLAKYGTKENYFKSISDDLMSMGVSIAYGGDTADVLATEGGLSTVISLGTVHAYMNSLGLANGPEGEYFDNNNTMNIFDPDFIDAANARIASGIEAGDYVNNPRVFGYTTDNELPSGEDFLMRYLLLNPDDPANGFSYATAWAWLARRLDNPNPTLDDYMNSPERGQLNSEFLGFAYARLYRINGEAIKRVDPNHMYLGSRVNGNCRTDPYYLHAAGYYLDILSINLYGGMNPDAETITNFYRHSGKPFIVTEFFAKGLDAIDANGYKLANSTGAGILVRTQEDRGDYYEHYAMALLESKACVGWVWYRYRDNDQGLYREVGKDNVLRMYQVNYSTGVPGRFVDENNNMLMADQVGEIETIYKGEPVASNQNVNKGFYNVNFSSAVTVYTYKGDMLTDIQTYEINKPASADLPNGSKVTAISGKTYTLGTVKEGNVTTETVLTVYEGKYLALTESVTDISNHLMGLVGYFDADMNK